jgi:hypothetical protein
MRFGLIIGMVGSLVGTATVAGASYLAWDQFQLAAGQRRLAPFEKFMDTLDIDIRLSDSSKPISGMLSGDFVLENVTIISDDKRVEVERVAFKNFDWKNPAHPQFGSITLTGMKFKGDVFSLLLGPEIGKVLEEEQFANIMVDLTLEHESGEEIVEDPKTKKKVKQNKVTIKELKLVFRSEKEKGSDAPPRHLATFTAQIDLRDFAVKPKSVARQAREEPPLVRLLGENVLFAGMKLVFEDGGLMKAFIDAKAREIAKGELQARGVFVKELQKDAQTTRSSVGSNKFDRDYFEPMIRYIGGGYERTNGFTIESKPAQPIELRRLFVMAEANRGGFYDKFNPKLTLGPQRAPLKKDPPPKKEERREREPRR